MRILPTLVQRNYLDELSTLAHARRKPAEATPKPKLPSPPILPPRKDSPLTPRKAGPAWFALLPRQLVERLSTCQAMLSRVPPIVILFVVLFVLFGFGRAFGHEVRPELDKQLEIERAGSAQPMPVEPVIVAPVSPAPTATGDHSGQADLTALFVSLGASTVGLLTLLLWISVRRRRLNRRLPPRTLHVKASKRKPSSVVAVTDKARDDEARQPASPKAADVLAVQAPDAWLLGLATHRGPVRPRNEDAGSAFTVGTHQVLVLADGVGGMPHGDEAARAVVRTAERAIRQAWRITPDGQEPLPKMMLSSAFAASAARLASSGLARGFASAAAGLRTTLIIVIGAADRFHFGYIGDGEIVLVRADGTVKSLSVPHKADPQVQNVLSASLGPIPQGTAEFGVTERRRSDLLVAATDGVTDRVAPAFYTRTLLRQAGRHGGDLTRTAESVLAQLSRHRDENGLFAFDDNMTLGLMGDGSAPTDPAQAPLTLAVSEVA